MTPRSGRTDRCAFVDTRSHEGLQSSAQRRQVAVLREGPRTRVERELNALGEQDGAAGEAVVRGFAAALGEPQDAADHQAALGEVGRCLPLEPLLLLLLHVQCVEAV